MSNINVGGVEGDLILNTREWTQPGREALSSFRNVGAGITTVFDTIDKSSETATRQLGNRLRDSRGRFLAFGQDAQQVANGVSQSFRGMSAGVNASLANIRNTCRDLSQNFSRFAQTARDVVGRSVSDFAKLDQAMHDLDSIAKLSGDQLGNVTKQVRAMGGEMGLTQGPNSLAEALKKINSFGYSAADSLKILRASAKGADAGQTDSTTFSRGVTSLLRNYSLNADASMLVTDQMFKAMDQGNIEASELATSIGSIAPVASLAGVSLQELLGSLSAMSLNGKAFSENVTNYRAVLLHLLSPARQAQKLLEQYGVQAGETAIRTKGLIGVVQDLYAKTGGNKNVLKKILDDEGLQASAALLKGDNGGLTKSYIGQQYKADGSTDDSLERRSRGLIFQFEKLKAAFENFSIGVGTGLSPVLGPATEELNKMAQSLVRMPDSTKAAIGAFAGLTAAVTTVASGVLLVAPSVIQVSKVVLDVGRVVKDFGGIAGAATRGATFFADGLAGIAATAAEVAAPLALVAAAGASLAAAWKNDWGGIKEFTTEVMADVYRSVTPVVDYMRGTLGPTVAQVATEISQNFRAVWPDVKEFFGWLGREIFEVAVPALRSYWETTKTVWSGVGIAIKTAWGVMKPVFRYIGEDVRAATEIFVTAIEGDWGTAMSLWWEYFKGIGPRIKSAFVDIIASVKSGFVEMAQTVRDGLRKAFTWQETPVFDMEQFQLVGARLKSELNRTGTLDSFGNFLRPFQEGIDGASQGLNSFVNTTALKFDSMTDHVKGKAKEMFEAFNPLKNGAKAYSSKDRVGGGPGTANDDPVFTGRATRTPKNKALTREEMIRYMVGRNAVEGNVSGLDLPTLRASYNLVKNAELANYPVIISSAYRPNSKGFHGSGQAVDVVTPDQPKYNWENRERPAMIRQLAAGTGFRSGLNEFRYADTARFTGATDAHVHLTTGLERQPGQGGYPGAFLVKGGSSGGGGAVVSAIQETLRKWTEDTKTVASYLAKASNEFDRKRSELKGEYSKALTAAKDIGADDKTIRDLTANYRRQVNEVNVAERREQEKTVSDLVITRLEAEGKMGEAARARIQATAAEEKARLLDVLNTAPQHGELVYSAVKAVDANAARQQEVQGLQQGADRFGAVRDIQNFKLEDPGMANLLASFPAFRTEVEAAYAAIQRYIKDPVDANRAAADAARQSLAGYTAEAQAAQQRKLQDIEFERSLGQITTEEAISRQGQILANWTGGEESKRQALLQYSDVYREHLQQTLELQGEFNLETLEGLAESLSSAGQLTAQQQAQLIATNQLIHTQRLQDQQNWMGILQTATGAFQGFLGGILTGQQSFSQSFSQLWKGLATQVVQEIVKMIVKATVLQKILNSIFGWFGGILGIGGGAVGVATDVGSIVRDAVPSFHTGGMMTSSGMRSLPRFHSGSLAGPGFSSSPLRSDEFMAVLQTNEAVLNRSQTRALTSGGGRQAYQRPAPNVYITNHNTINNEMDLDRVGQYLGRQIQLAVQGV